MERRRLPYIQAAPFREGGQPSFVTRHRRAALIGLAALAVLIPGAAVLFQAADRSITNDMTVSGNPYLAAERGFARCTDPADSMTQVRRVIASGETTENGGANLRSRPMAESKPHDRFPLLPVGSTVITAPADYEYSPSYQAVCAIYGPDGTPVMIKPGSPAEMAFINSRVTEIIQKSIGK